MMGKRLGSVVALVLGGAAAWLLLFLLDRGVLLLRPTEALVSLSAESPRRARSSPVVNRTCWVRLNNDLVDYETVQAAVDASNSPGDLVKVAGRCTGVAARPAPAGYDGGSTVTQTLYLAKNLTIRGGYTVTDWYNADPVARATTLDAQGRGRVILVAEAASPTIEGLHLTGGDAAGVGGWSDPWTALDAGGGVYVVASSPAIRNNWIHGNVADDGGGLFFYAAPASLLGNRVFSNTAIYGGGMSLWLSDAVLSGNRSEYNSAVSGGGGVFVSASRARLEANLLLNNLANDNGGGAILWKSDATLVNLVIADNRAGAGAGLHLIGSAPRLFHTTLARNQGACGVSATDDQQGQYSTVAMTNTILVDHAIGISVTGGSDIVLHGVLWHGNGTNAAGAGAVLVTQPVTRAPRFAPDGYHLTLSSGALDAGLAAGIGTDLDGDLRPGGRAPDLGADEVPGRLQPDRQGDVLPGGQVVYTHTLSNTANAGQRFSLAAGFSSGFTATVWPTRTSSLPPFGGAIVTVTVDAPAGALSGTWGLAVVTATGSLIGRDSACDRTTVRLDHGSPDLTPDRAGRARPGETRVYTHTLVNRANAWQSFELAAVSSLQYDLSVHPGQTPWLAPFGGSMAISVSLGVPSGAEQGMVDITQVTAVGNLGGWATAVDTTTVKTDMRPVYLPLVVRL